MDRCLYIIFVTILLNSVILNKWKLTLRVIHFHPILGRMVVEV